MDGTWTFKLPDALQAGAHDLRAAVLGADKQVVSQSEVLRVQLIPATLPGSGGVLPAGADAFWRRN